MSDRWLNIYHFYHLSITHQVQMDCPKSVLQFGQFIPTAWTLSAQAMGHTASLPLTHRKSAIKKL